MCSPGARKQDSASPATKDSRKLWLWITSCRTDGETPDMFDESLCETAQFPLVQLTHPKSCENYRDPAEQDHARQEW